MAAYGTLVTNLGNQLIARHLQEGGKLEITHFGVGDGGGQAYQPTADMTALRGERWRGAVNKVEISPDSPNVLVIDALVPAEVGGFTIREAAVFDAHGNMIGIMNTPQTEKVAAEDGATAEQYIQMYLAVSSAESIALSVDPSVVLVSRRDVEAEIARHDGDEGAHGDIREALAGKVKSATLVVGTLLANCTASDVDFLCDGIDDQEEINAAIQALPEGGGKVVIREGTYRITDNIRIERDSVIIEGVGPSTVLERGFVGNNLDGRGLIYGTGAYCTVRDLFVESFKEEYNANYNYSICLLGDYCSVTGTNVNSSLGSDNTFSRTALGQNANADTFATTALGPSACATAQYSTALGATASAAGSYSIALGYGASVTDSAATALGYGAAAAGNNSTALGNGATTTGSFAIALGSANAAGTCAVALGSSARAAGSHSVAVGRSSNAAGEYSVALGLNSSAAEADAHTIQLGSASSLYFSELRCRVNLTVSSDQRDKIDIQEIPKSLDFIKLVTPIQFVHNQRVEYIDHDKLTEEQQDEYRKYGICEYDRKAHAAGEKKGERKRVGVSAQQLLEALESVYGTADYANLVNDNLHDVRRQEDIPASVESQYTVAYTELIPFLIGAVQELSVQIEQIQARVAELEAR